MLWRDLRFGLRTLSKSPGFAVVAVLTLALGIGANSAIFSVVNGILLRPAPFHDPSRLVAVLDRKGAQGVDWLSVSPARYFEWLRRNTVFEQIAAAYNCYYRLPGQDTPRLLQGGCVSASFFPMLGVRPVIGRLFTADEDQAGRNHVLLLSYEFWQQQYARDPAVLGKTIRRTADGREFTIIGVLPRDFQFATAKFVAWAPLNVTPDSPRRDDHYLLVFARLKNGVTLEQAQGAMDGVAQQLSREFPAASSGWGITVQPLQRFYSDVRNTRTTLWVLLASVGFLLLIACANIANLLMARATARRREIAVRLAIGATRWRIIRQLATESVLLGVAGGAAGFLLAGITFDWLLALVPYIPSFRPHAIRVDGAVFGFAMATAMLASVAFGLTPTLDASGLDVNAALRAAARGSTAGLRHRLLRNLLVAAEMTLAVVLLAGAGLLVQTFRNLQTDRLGFRSDHVLTMGICCLDDAHYPGQREISAFWRQVFERLRAVPGVDSASGANELPLRQLSGAGSPFEVEGQPAAEPGREPTSDFLLVEPHYFEALRIPLVRGRSFTEHDDSESVPVAIVNETLARSVFAGQDPIGRQVRATVGEDAGRWYRIVGVAADTKGRGLGTETRSTIYHNYFQYRVRYTFFLIHTRGDPLSVAGEVKNAISAVDRDLPLDTVRTLEQALAESVATQRFSMSLVALFAGLALTLAAIGVYGVTAYSVAQRTHELGVRVAMGAQPADIIRLVLGEGARIGLLGAVAGVLGGLALTRLMANLLYGVHAADPLTFAVVPLILMAVVLAASYIPARRAMKVDPTVALRCE